MQQQPATIEPIEPESTARAYGERPVIGPFGELVGEYLLHEPRPSPFYFTPQVFTHLWGNYPTLDSVSQELALARYFHKRISQSQAQGINDAENGF